jgi:hypothetical protein
MNDFEKNDFNVTGSLLVIGGYNFNLLCKKLFCVNIEVVYD